MGDKAKTNHGRTLPSPPGRSLSRDEWSKQLNQWHYLGASCKGVVLAWGHDEGCCIYGNPRSRNIEKWFPDLMVGELIRMVGAPGHLWSMTSLMAQAHKHLNYDVLVTYADPTAGHNGAVYRAGNWISVGLSSNESVWVLDGKRISRRWVYDQHGTQSQSRAKEIYGDRLIISPGQPKPRFILGLSKRGKKAVSLFKVPG